MLKKYTNSAVADSLKEWEHAKDLEPDLDSIKSRLMEIGSETNIILYKRYPIFSMLNIPNHYYLYINGKIWHPGHESSDDIFHRNDSESGYVVGFTEMCSYCTYHFFFNLFKKDKKFNILTNNCQKITGFIFETVLILTFHVTLILFIFTRKIILFVIAITMIFIIFIYVYISRPNSVFPYSKCPHIKNIT